jgi:hypothetical protein
MKLILYRFNGVRISYFHYRYNEASMETRNKEEKIAQFAYGVSLTSIFVFHISANPCDGMTCQNNGTCLVNMADGTAQCCCNHHMGWLKCEIQIWKLMKYPMQIVQFFLLCYVFPCLLHYTGNENKIFLLR